MFPRECDRAGALAELADVRAAGAQRPLGVALRVAGLTEGASEGLALLTESVTVLGRSSALLERAQCVSWRRRPQG